MINLSQNLVKNIFTTDKLEKLPTRDGFGHGLLEIGARDERVVVLCADLSESTRAQWFAEKWPERFFQIGVAEQNMATVAAGLALAGKIPFMSSFAAFSPGRCVEQIRTTACLNNLPVKIAGSHAGISTGPDGATHQPLEDIASMRVLPRMTVIVPADAVEARKATVAAAGLPGPVYLRFCRAKTPVFTTPATTFEVGKAQVLTHGKDVTLVASGILVYEALLAAQELAKQGISVEVINNHTIKPLDKETLIASSRKTGLVVTLEEHQVAGGMGSAIAEMLVENYPVPMKMIGVRDRFGESGETDELLEAFGLTALKVAEMIKEAVRKREAMKKMVFYRENKNLFSGSNL